MNKLHLLYTQTRWKRVLNLSAPGTTCFQQVWLLEFELIQIHILQRTIGYYGTQFKQSIHSAYAKRDIILIATTLNGGSFYENAYFALATFPTRPSPGANTLRVRRSNPL